MIKVGDTVFVRDNYIQKETHVWDAMVIDIQMYTTGKVDYQLKFQDGTIEWFSSHALKTE